MVKIGELLGGALEHVSPNMGPCTKCKKVRPPLQRHHIAHESMFVEAFEETRGRELAYRVFVARYKSFHPDDWVYLCDSCHEEIHVLYYSVGTPYRAQHGPFRHMNWAEARELMGLFANLYHEWLNDE